MGDSLDDELAALRARAYGPDADIHDDAAALARLRELEEQEHAHRLRTPPMPPLPVAKSPMATPPPPPATRITPQHPTPDPSPAHIVSDSPEPSPPASSRTPRRRVLLACAASALVGAVIAVPATLIGAGIADRPYAVLSPSDREPDPQLFDPDSDPVQFEDFLGIEVSAGTLEYMPGERCLLVGPSPTQTQSNNTRGTCSPEAFGAVVDIPAVAGYLSAEVREQLGDITALRFMLVGDEVHVFVARELPAGGDS